MKHIAVYYRVSTEDQDITSQVAAVKAYVGQGVTKVYRDEGVSGFTTRRPGYQSMLRAVAADEVSEVVVFALDRLGRNSIDSIKQIMEFDRLGVCFTSVTQPVFSSGNPLRKTMVALFSEIAEIEHRNISNRVKAGIQANRHLHDTWGGIPTMLTSEMLQRVAGLRAAGLSVRGIATEVGCSPALIQKALKKLA